jgi:hypothetical protein
MRFHYRAEVDKIGPIRRVALPLILLRLTSGDAGRQIRRQCLQLICNNNRSGKNSTNDDDQQQLLVATVFPRHHWWKQHLNLKATHTDANNHCWFM